MHVVPPPGYKTIFVCQCGNTTFILEPGYKASCAACFTEIVSDEGVGGWRKGAEPRVPPELKEDQLEQTVVSFNNHRLTWKNVLRWLDKQTDAVILICVLEDGTMKTYGTIEGETQQNWLERRLERARSMLIKDYGPPKFTEKDVLATESDVS